MPAPHRLYGSIVAVGVSLSGCTCSESHPPPDGSALPDAVALDVTAPPDTPVAVDTGPADTGPDACPAHCPPCDGPPECGGCLTCII